MDTTQGSGRFSKVVRRRAGLVISLALCAMALGSVVSLGLPRVYCVETKLEVGSAGGLSGEEYAERVDAVNERLMTHEAFSDLAKTLGLDAHFSGLPEAERNEAVAALAAALRAHSAVATKATANPPSHVTITHRNDDADLAVRVVGALCDSYKRLASDQTSAAQEKSVADLVKTQSDAKSAYDRAVAERAEYREKNHEFLDGAKEKLQATRDRKKQLRDGTITGLEQQKRQYDGLLSQEKQFEVVKTKQPDTARLAAIDARISDAKERLEQLTAVEKKSEAHSEVIAQRTRLADAEEERRKLYSEAREVETRQPSEHWMQLSKAKQEVQSQLDGANVQLRLLTATEREQEELAKRTPEIEAREKSLGDVETEAKTQWDAKTADLAKAERALTELRARGTLAVRSLDAPVKPRHPAGPGALVLALAGLVVGAGVGLGVALALDAMDRSFREVDAVSHFLGIPAMGAIQIIQTPSEAAQKRRVKRRQTAILAALAVVALLVFAVALLGDVHAIRDLVKSVAG